jgi:plasmid stabilization system protein ParE
LTGRRRSADSDRELHEDQGSLVCDNRLGERTSFLRAQGEDLGEYFLDSLFSDIDSLALHAGIHQKVFGKFRMLSRRFPYAIYYRIADDVALVIRVLDLRQDPEKTRKALK